MAARGRESGGRPAPRRDERPKPAPDRKPEPRPAPRPENRPSKPAPHPPERGHSTPHTGGGGGEHAHGGGPTAEAASAGGTEAPDKASIFQQEVDVLRGQVTELHVVGLFSPKTAPKVAGVYGRLLQGLDAGVSFRDAFANLNHAATATRNNSAHVLSLIRAHKTPMFSKPKGR